MSTLPVTGARLTTLYRKDNLPLGDRYAQLRKEARKKAMKRRWKPNDPGRAVKDDDTYNQGRY